MSGFVLNKLTKTSPESQTSQKSHSPLTVFFQILQESSSIMELGPPSFPESVLLFERKICVCKNKLYLILIMQFFPTNFLPSSTGLATAQTVTAPPASLTGAKDCTSARITVPTCGVSPPPLLLPYYSAHPTSSFTQIHISLQANVRNVIMSRLSRFRIGCGVTTQRVSEPRPCGEGSRLCCQCVWDCRCAGVFEC
jgi:hypothetical protein